MKLSIAPLRRSRMHLSGKPGPWDSRKDTGGEFAAFGCGEFASYGRWRICSLRFAVNCVQRPRRFKILVVPGRNLTGTQRLRF